MIRLMGVVALALGGAIASAQAGRPAAPQQTGTVDWQTKIGSFKILSPNSDVKAFGRISMSFQGTVLVVGLEGRVTPGPGVKMQYRDEKQGRTVYFGRGTLAIEGKWRAIQFFGRDYKGTWTGLGVMRLYGEFDEKLETGTYQVRGFPPEAWGSGGRTINLPQPVAPGKVKPKIQDIKPRRPGL